MASMAKLPAGYVLRHRARDDFDAVYVLTTRIALARHGEADFHARRHTRLPRLGPLRQGAAPAPLRGMSSAPRAAVLPYLREGKHATGGAT